MELFGKNKDTPHSQGSFISFLFGSMTAACLIRNYTPTTKSYIAWYSMYWKERPSQSMSAGEEGDMIEEG
eukprot:859219-Pelagomonas_calceolata.AAC.1